VDVLAELGILLKTVFLKVATLVKILRARERLLLPETHVAGNVTLNVLFCCSSHIAPAIRQRSLSAAT
jgi:hypothetical protein